MLKQVQFVWGAPYCNRDCTQPAAAKKAAAAAKAALAVHSSSRIAHSAQRRLQEQHALTDGAVQTLLEQMQARQEARQQWRLAAAAATSAADAMEPSLDAEFAAINAAGLKEAAAAADEDDSALQQHSRASSRRNSSAVVVPASIHRALSVIAPDTRVECPVKAFPYEAMGQIKAKAADGGFVCSGGLIGANRVLTAGHCVWDDRGAQGPFKDLRFAAGQWRDGATGKLGSVFGGVDWDYVTLFDSYVNDPDGEGLPFDVAVITLNKPVGTELGWLGIKAEAPPCRSAPLSLTLAGYPGDDAGSPPRPGGGGWAGGCFYDQCDVWHSCGVSITNHTCDSYVGQSGAPMFDDQYYVRAVHTLGVLPGFSTTNGAITIQKFILDNVMGYWRDTEGFTRTKSGGIGGLLPRGRRRRRRQ